MRTLIVEDHTMIREGLILRLEDLPDIEIVGQASDGAEAIRLTGELHPDLIIMDIAMPRLNGIEAARTILSMDHDPVPRIIFLSMHIEREYVIEAFRAGGRAYIIKSSIFEELAQAVMAVCEGGTYISPAVGDLLIEEVTGIAPQTEAGPYQVLTPRERQVLQLLADGMNAKEIGEMLGVSDKTIHANRVTILAKLNLRGVADLTKYAIKHGITTLES